MGAFYGTDLDLQLRRHGINTIVLCGVSTNIGADTTAREAFQHGYNQILATDAMTASTKEEHDYVCKYICPRCGASFKVSVFKYILAFHLMGKRMAKCPNCGHTELMAPKWDKR